MLYGGVQREDNSLCHWKERNVNNSYLGRYKTNFAKHTLTNINCDPPLYPADPDQILDLIRKRLIEIYFLKGCKRWTSLLRILQKKVYQWAKFLFWSGMQNISFPCMLPYEQLIAFSRMSFLCIDNCDVFYSWLSFKVFKTCLAISQKRPFLTDWIQSRLWLE